MRGLRKELGACDQCGKCAPDAQQLIRDCLRQGALSDAHSRPAGRATMTESAI